LRLFGKISEKRGAGILLEIKPGPHRRRGPFGTVWGCESKEDPLPYSCDLRVERYTFKIIKIEQIKALLYLLFKMKNALHTI
jgi:hypothetical protein